MKRVQVKVNSQESKKNKKSGFQREKNRYNKRLFAGVAQLVEQLICNQPVRSSNPLTSSKEFKGLHANVGLFYCLRGTGGAV